jgi:aspartate/methionine/tyrosine aminotransferase
MNHSRQHDVHGYQSYTGIPQLRDALSRWYKNFFKVPLNPDSEILPLMGSKEGIMHISLAFLNPGDKVLVPDPGYPTYAAVARIVGAEVIRYNLLEQNNWLPDFEELESAAKKGIKILWLNYPHMPTGTKATRTLLEKIIGYAQQHKILVVNDNPYSFILNEEPLSILSIPGAKEVAVELNSLSKSHNMAGWRIGCVAGKAEYLKCILAIKSNMDSGMFKPVQFAAAKALEKGATWYQEINKEYGHRQKLALGIFDKLRVEYGRDQSGMFVWGKIPPVFSDSYNFSDHYLNGNSVFITPGAIFGTNGNNYVRISLCSTQETFGEVLSRFL